MKSKVHLQSLRTWRTRAEQFEAAREAQSEFITSQELLIVQMDLLAKGKILLQEFERERDTEDANAAHCRAVGRNLWKNAQPHYGEGFDEVCELIDEEIEPKLEQWEKQLKRPIGAIRAKVKAVLQQKAHP